MGAFAVSAVLHDLCLWGLGQETEFRTADGFFLLMGVGAAFEHTFKVMTGGRVGVIWGWAWTMVWAICWGTLIIDAWARRRMRATDFVQDGWPRPGRLLVDAIISLSQKESGIYVPQPIGLLRRITCNQPSCGNIHSALIGSQQPSSTSNSTVMPGILSQLSSTKLLWRSYYKVQRFPAYPIERHLVTNTTFCRHVACRMIN